ncbi:MAG: hypothetical protein H6P98_367 [Candidatus Aminicenantes bacterium]|nr:hypothetical protein [Candidatus Aminicenantes bacterium]
MSLKKLALLALAAMLALFFMGLTPAPEDSQEEFQKTLPLNSAGTFSLKNVNGEVRISTWKEAKVEIKALKKTSKDVQNLQKVKIEVTASAAAVSIDTVYPKHENTGVSVDYDIQVPEGITLGGVDSVNGGVHITGPFGRVTASTTNGSVHVEDASGNLRLETTNGDVEAVRIAGPVDAHTTNGDITLELTKLEAAVTAETTNGGVTLRLGGGQETNGLFEAETTNGSLSFDIPVTMQSLEKSRRHLRGQIGQGGPLVSLKTVNGSIRLTR